MEINKDKTVEKDELTGDKLLSGHDYDNIRELDNNLPKWWVWLFIITIVGSVIYPFVTTSQKDEWNKEMASAGVLAPGQAAPVDPASLVALTDQASLDAGKEIWVKQCQVCHLAGGQGIVGPNLTDDFSIHGCNYGDVVNIVVVGAPEKGMISWKTQLSDIQIKQVSSFVMTLKGTNPPNPKAPQGEPCK
jgi:cytochrome c oxidase cbb3-type subunit 3